MYTSHGVFARVFYVISVVEASNHTCTPTLSPLSPFQDSTLKRMGLVAAHLSFQADAIQRGVHLTPEIEESLSSTLEKVAPIIHKKD